MNIKLNELIALLVGISDQCPAACVPTNVTRVKYHAPCGGRRAEVTVHLVPRDVESEEHEITT